METIRDRDGNEILTIDKELMFAVFDCVDLSNADFNGKCLRYTQFYNCNVKDADFRGADLLGATIVWTDFREAITDKKTLFPTVVTKHQVHALS